MQLAILDNWKNFKLVIAKIRRPPTDHFEYRVILRM